MPRVRPEKWRKAGTPAFVLQQSFTEPDDIGKAFVIEGDSEKGSHEPDPNIDRVAIELASYYSMKRLIGLRSMFIVSALALVIGALSPSIGIDLEFGGLIGVGNMFLVMRGNERFLDQKIGRARRASENIQRLIIMATAPVVTTLWSPWWGMGVTLCGIFMPLALYVLELQHRYRTRTK